MAFIDLSAIYTTLDANSLFDVNGSTSEATAYLRAVRQLIAEIPRRSGKGTEEYEFDMESLRHMEARALAFLRSASGGDTHYTTKYCR